LQDDGPARAAGLVGTAIYPILLLKISGLSATINKIAQGAPACFNGQFERDLDCLHQFFTSNCPELTGSGHGSNASAKKRFISVNVSHPYNDPAIHQHFLDARASPPGSLVQQWSGKCLCERLGSKLRQQWMFHDVRMSPEYRTEASRITQAQNNAIIQKQIGMVMLFGETVRTRRQQSETAGHTEMQDQRSLAAIQQDIFSAPHDPANFRAPHRLVQIGWNWPSQMGISYLRSGYATTFQMGYDPPPDDFDFR
jgi:hypothetical protein